jgi:hypothetical protein
MRPRIHQLVWLTSGLVCLAGIIMVVFGLIRNRQAEPEMWVGSQSGLHEATRDRFHRADMLAKAGAGVVGVGAIIMLGECFIALRSTRT